jgi:RNA polymerase sigma-70 factor (ECF subfamily)
MPDADDRQRLSRISTHWSLVFQAHQGEPTRIPEAQQELLQRYHGAIYRYLVRALRGPDAAEEVAQEFAYCLVRGDFRKANPAGGRFRDLVRTVAFHLIVNYQRRRKKDAQVAPLSDQDAPQATLDLPFAEADAEFLRLWREELLDRAWESLAAVQGETNQPYYAVLRLRAEQPQLASEQMAEQLGLRLRKTFQAAGVRQVLHRAREKFADLLLEEVAHSLQGSTPELLEQELIDLGLLSYCQSALKRRNR